MRCSSAWRRDLPRCSILRTSPPSLLKSQKTNMLTHPPKPNRWNAPKCLLVAVAARRPRQLASLARTKVCSFPSSVDRYELIYPSRFRPRHHLQPLLSYPDELHKPGTRRFHLLKVLLRFFSKALGCCELLRDCFFGVCLSLLPEHNTFGDQEHIRSWQSTILTETR